MSQYEKYMREFELYKDEPLPDIGEEFVLHTSPRTKNIVVRVIQYNDDDTGMVETIHSKKVTSKTNHAIRKMYKKSGKMTLG